MGRVIVIEFTAQDGVIQDPDGSDGFRHGGWAFRYGPAAVAGDKFALGEIMQTGALLLGRRTWQRFAAIWPRRDDDFSRAMNAMPKLVLSKTLAQASEWQNSQILRGDLAEEVSARRQAQDLVVAGSMSVATVLGRSDLVDEYMLLVSRS